MILMADSGVVQHRYVLFRFYSLYIHIYNIKIEALCQGYSLERVCTVFRTKILRNNIQTLKIQKNNIKVYF